MTSIVTHDFNGHSVSFTDSAWFNATEASARFGKRPIDWLRLPETTRYLEALIRKAKVGKSHFVMTKRGGRTGEAGTWLHPKLAVRFAQWLDVDFAVWCDDQIDNIVRRGIVSGGHAEFLSLILRAEPAKWALRFHPSYYKALAKMTGLRYSGHAGGTPALFGQITERWVYGALLPREVHDELRARKDKSEKMHQWLTEGGQQRLDQHVTLVTLLAQSATDQKDFEARCMQSFGMPGQLRLVFPVAA